MSWILDYMSLSPLSFFSITYIYMISFPLLPPLSLSHIEDIACVYVCLDMY
jgi:hypothetical protein